MNEVPGHWERVPSLAPTGDSLAFRSEQYPALVAIVHPKRTHVYVKFRFMTGDDAGTIVEQSFDRFGTAVEFAENIMDVASWSITGADGGNPAMRERFEENQ
jgi:hypothetical protein